MRKEIYTICAVYWVKTVDFGLVDTSGFSTCAAKADTRNDMEPPNRWKQIGKSDKHEIPVQAQIKGFPPKLFAIEVVGNFEDLNVPALPKP